MPDIRDPNTVKAMAKGYLANDRDKSKGLMEAGYSRSTAYSGRCTILYDRTEVKQAITGLEQELSAKTETTVTSVHGLYQTAYNQAQALNQPSAMVSAVTGIARLYGMDKDHEVGSKEAAVPVTAEQTEEYRAMAKAAIKLKLSRGA